MRGLSLYVRLSSWTLKTKLICFIGSESVSGGSLTHCRQIKRQVQSSWCCYWVYICRIHTDAANCNAKDEEIAQHPYLWMSLHLHLAWSKACQPLLGQDAASWLSFSTSDADLSSSASIICPKGVFVFSCLFGKFLLILSAFSKMCWFNDWMSITLNHLQRFMPFRWLVWSQVGF